MNFFPSRWVLLAAVGLAAFSAPAQETLLNSKQTDEPVDKANSFLDDSKRQIHAGDYNAPRQLFSNPGPSLPLPPPLFLNQDPSVQDALNKRRNWMLLTPEEILGIKTPEEILGIKNPDDEKKLSLEEKFLLRQSRAAAGAATNGRAGNLFGKDDQNPFAKNQNDQNPFSSGPTATADQKYPNGLPRQWNQLFSPKVGDSFSGNDRRQESAWTSAFAQPAQPKITPEQLADRERFRALMEPSSPPDKPAPPPGYSTTVLPAPNPYLQPQPKFNPAGRSYSTLENNAARPMGINPLPGITGPAPKPVEKRPSWMAQPAPWLTDGPQARNPNRGF